MCLIHRAPYNPFNELEALTSIELEPPMTRRLIAMLGDAHECDGKMFTRYGIVTGSVGAGGLARSFRLTSDASGNGLIQFRLREVAGPQMTWTAVMEQIAWENRKYVPINDNAIAA